MQIFFAIIIFAFGLNGYAQDQSSHPVKPQTAKTDQNAKGNQTGTSNHPLFVNGEVTTKKTPEDAESEAKERNEKSAIDAALVKYTGISALIAGFAFVAAVVQIALFVWQLKLMRKAVADAEDVAKSAKISAESALKEFFATHRPKIIVHSFEPTTDDGDKLGVELTYVNIGETKATLIEFGEKVFHSDEIRPGTSMAIHAINKTIDPGEYSTRAIFTNIERNHEIINDMARSRNQDRPLLYCIGYFLYSDANGSKRRTGFCRVYDADSDMWKKVENSDYEYSY